jgi:hypothetical protein
MMEPRVAIGTTWRSLWWFGLVVLMLFAPSCARDPISEGPDGPVIDARPYAEGYCSLRCYRVEECGLDPDVSREACEQACYDDAIDALDDPCWVEEIELDRCVVREMSCDDVAQDHPEIADGSPCEAWRDRLDACDE